MSVNPRAPLLAISVWLALALTASGGAPSFAPRVDVPLGPDGCRLGDCSSAPQSVALVDLDGNGSLDAVTANALSDDVTILLNDGAGALTVFGTLSALGANGVAAADFDEDGNADLAVAQINSDAPESTVGIYAGNGDGTFASPLQVAVGLFPEEIVIADFDADGHMDFATQNLFDDSLTVRLGNGDGTFASARTIDLGGGPSGIAVGNFDGGPVDLAVTLEEPFPGEVVILLGDGSGGFDIQSPNLQVGDTPLSVATGDLDGDGVEDLAVPNWAEDTVSVLFGNGDGSFEPGPVLDSGLFPEDVTIADLDGDLAADIVTLDSFGSDTADGLLVVHPGNGDGTFADIELYEVGSSPSVVEVADLNGDGALDVLTAHFDSDDLGVLLNAAAAVACVGDCDGDGSVSIAELIRGVNIALGQQPVGNCPEFDRNDDGKVSISELVAAVNNALSGCPNS